MVAKILDTFGKRVLIGYDIGCSFRKTVGSSTLGPLFEELEALLCVNAFHGYSHNYKCQLSNHPNIIKGLGLEDLETAERIFSASNALAVVTRYMSPYRRRIYIAMFFAQWDEDKYAELSKYLLEAHIVKLTTFYSLRYIYIQQRDAGHTRHQRVRTACPPLHGRARAVKRRH